MHDWWSPLVPWRGDKYIRRDDVESLTLLVHIKGEDKPVAVPLTELLNAERAKRPGGPQSKKGAKPDAIFFSFEALDKFLFPQLAATYGVMGAWQMRTGVRNQLGDERPDFKVFEDWEREDAG
jgi:hypothetical protein